MGEALRHALLPESGAPLPESGAPADAEARDSGAAARGSAAIAGKLAGPSFPGLAELAAGRRIEEGQVLALLPWIRERRDCADFRAAALLKALCGYEALLSPGTLGAVKEALLGFRYSMEDPGEDSMCLWSENHQILFAAAEYLSGRLWPEERFDATGLQGMWHRERGKARCLDWLALRWRHGFSEWHSNTYYVEDAAALALLVDYAEEELSAKAAIVLDLLLLDLALHSLHGFFAAASGRCYEAQKKDPLAADTIDLAEALFGFDRGREPDRGNLGALLLLSERYRLPPLLREIARSPGPAIVRSSMGLELKEVAKEFPRAKPGGSSAARGLFLWGMEAFTNPESVCDSLELWKAWRLRNNAFLRELRLLDLPLPGRKLLLPLAIRLLNPVTRGIAIQRGNTYTMRGLHWMLSTAQRHHPGEFADQQHLWQATLESGATVFSTHPASPAFSDAERCASPGAWVGSGLLPDAAQEGNVLLAIYDLRARPGLLEGRRKPYTHAWLPPTSFEELRIEGNRAFGRSGGAYLALLGRFAFREGPEGPAELVQEGLLSFWICELADEEDWAGRGGFEGFVAEIRSRRVGFRGRRLVYEGRKRLELEWKGLFKVDGEIVDRDFPRLDSPWGQVPRKPERLELRSREHGILLDFEAGRREAW